MFRQFVRLLRHQSAAKRDGHLPRRRKPLQKTVAEVCCSDTALHHVAGWSLPMLLGYARVSIDDQDLTLQRKALHEAGCQ